VKLWVSGIPALDRNSAEKGKKSGLLALSLNFYACGAKRRKQIALSIFANMERSKKQLVPKSGDEIQLLDPQTLNISNLTHSTGLSP